MRPFYLFCLLLLSFTSCQNKSYDFFVAGHVYGKPGADNPGVHPPFEACFQEMAADSSLKFGIFTGDIVRTSTIKDWAGVDSSLAVLNKKIYMVPGNHEFKGDKAYFQKRQKLHQYFKKGDDLFVLLNTNHEGWTLGEKQKKWFLDLLENEGSKARNIFVFFHQYYWWNPDKPLSKAKPNSMEGYVENNEYWGEIDPQLKALKRPVYLFVGDAGAWNGTMSFFMYNEENVHYVGSGMGGGKKDNYLRVKVKKDGTVKLLPIPLKGVEKDIFKNPEDFRI